MFRLRLSKNPISLLIQKKIDDPYRFYRAVRKEDGSAVSLQNGVAGPFYDKQYILNVLEFTQ